MRTQNKRFGLCGAVATLALASSALAQSPPANDDCASASVLVPGLTAFDNTFATTDGVALDPFVCDMSTFGDDQIYLDVWYCFTPPTTDNYDVTTFGLAGIDTRLAIYDNGCGPDDPATVISCNDDVGPFPFEAGLTFAAIAGTPYKIRLGSYGDSAQNLIAIPGAGDLLVQIASPPPANDDCANATPLNAFGTYALDNRTATTDGADMTGSCDLATFGTELVHKDVWFAYTPTFTGCTYISTFGLGGFDSSMAVYASSSCPDDPSTIIACSGEEEQNPLVAPWEAGLDVDLIAGQTYLIRIGSYGDGFGFVNPGGAGQFQIAAGPIAANNDGGLQMGAPGCAPPGFFPEFCFGDGGNQLGCTNCPCGNNAPIGSGGGCLNSGGDGIQLIPSGDTSVSLPSGDTTDLRFGANGAPPTAFCILNSGDALAPGNAANPCFGMNSGAQAAAFDGLRCAIVNTRRHGGRSADVNGDVGVTNNPWGGEGGPPVGLANAGGGFAAGQTRFFQIVNRDDPDAVCTRALNTSQAVQVTFTP